MLLGRLRLRGKLALLVMIPLLAMAGLTVPVVVGLVDGAARSADIVDAAALAGRVGSLLQDVERERLLSVGYLLGATDRDELVLQTTAVTDRVADIQDNIGGVLPSDIRHAVDGVDGLSSVRQEVLAGTIAIDATIDTFASVIDATIDALRLLDRVDVATPVGRQMVALDALLRMDESNSESTALLASMTDGRAAQYATLYSEEVTERETYVDRFSVFATPTQQSLYALVADAFAARLGTGFADAFEEDPVHAMGNRTAVGLFPSLDSFNVLGIFVEKRIITDVTAAVRSQQRRELATAYGVGGLAALILLLVLVLVAAVARAVAVPLTRLTESAELVARAGEAELQRVADDESEVAEPVRLDVLDVSARDEIGDLARAFDRVQETAAQLVERQVQSRRNVAEMFGHIGRRTQNLVGRQVGLIDHLETAEDDPRRLEQLYRLDHLSNRLRRNASSLVVLSGSDRADEHLAPVRLVDVVRLALAEIEEYTRVDVDVPQDLLLSPAVVSDLVLVCAELLENGTNFSPPHTRVTVSARLMPGGVRLTVVDHGLGLSAERLAEENTRIARRERLDLVPTQVLGLFVVGRLARRHGFGVTLTATLGGGVTVLVDLAESLLTMTAVAGPAGALPVRGLERGDGRPELPAGTVPDAGTLEALVGEIPVAALDSRPAEPPDWWVVDDSTAARPNVVPAPARPVPAIGRAAPVAGTAPPFGSEALSRASDVIQERRPWNAFEIGSRAPTSEPALPTRPAAPAPPAPQAPPARPTPAARPTPVSTSGLRQRVPGAQLPSTGAPVAPAPPAVPADAEAARSMIEAFEIGVRRAQDQTGAWPTSAAAAGPPASRPATSPAPASPPSLASPAAPRPERPAGPGPRPLNRRVPGATLSDMDLDPPRPAPERAAIQDPGAVRNLVEQFESGVARALRDATEVPHSEKESSR